ncbi:MAG: inositol 2-dehydrogenase [Christensenellales bacterium]|jgi:myo-inositol 2-dehydrogenase/D-chiro-inositol 1-dehydrogenase
MINVAIIGAGRIGKVHAESIYTRVKGAKVVAIADPFLTEETVSWAKGLGIERCEKDYRPLLADKSIEAVLICSSTDTHSAISIEAAKAGKHIFCEKPIDHDVEKIKQVQAAVESAGVKYQVGFNRRFDHNFMAARQAVESGSIGELNLLKIASRDPAPPPVSYIKVSGGLFLDMAIHDFDMVRYISGSEVEEVFAYGAVLVDGEIGNAGDIDTAIISMRLENGALAVIDNCRRSAYGYDQRLEAFGSLGQASVGNDTAANLEIASEKGMISQKPLYFFLERYMDAYAREIKMFVDSLTNDTPTPAGLKDGLMAVVVGLAAKESLDRHAPVKVKEILRKYNL